MSQWAAGWYPDPEQPGQVRYWDGSAWTEHRQPAQDAIPLAEQPGVDRSSTEPTATQPAWAQGTGAAGSGDGSAGGGSGSGSKALLLVAAGTLVGLILLCLIGFLAFRIIGGDDTSSPTPSGPTTSTPGTTSPTSPSSSPTSPSSSPGSSTSPDPSGATSSVSSVVEGKVGTTYRGSGNGVIIVPDKGEAGLVEAEFTGKGGSTDRPSYSTFRVSGEDSKGVRSNDYAVFSWFGPAKGTGAYNLVGAGATHRLKIESDGEWSITFRDLDDAPELTDSVTGTSDQVLAWDGDSGDIRVTYASGSRYGGTIRISAVGADDYPDRLVSEYEQSWEGTTTVQSGTTYLIVTAQAGEWEITRR